MSVKTIGRCGHWLDMAAPALVVLALASFVLGVYCAARNFDTAGFGVDAAGFAILTCVMARITSHDSIS